MRIHPRFVTTSGLCLLLALLVGSPGFALVQAPATPHAPPSPVAAPRAEISRLAPEAAMQRDSQTKRLEQSVAALGRRVSISGNASNLQVSAVEGDEVRVVVELEYWSNNSDWMAAVGREFDIEIDESSREIEISFTDVSDLAEEGWIRKMIGTRTVSFDMDVTVEVPRATPLSIDNRYGDVTVDNVGGPIEVSNTSGMVEVVGVEGEAEIDNRYGDVLVTQVNGDLTVTATSGDVNVGDISGTADISNQYGAVEVEGITGQLDLRATSCEVSVSNAQDVVNVDNSYGDVILTSIAGPLDIDLSSGDVRIQSVQDDARLNSVEGEIRQIGGSLEVENSYGDLLIEEVGGSVTVTNTSGGVTLSSAGGDTEITLSYAAARINGVNGSLRVSGTSAAVQASNVTGPVDVETSYEGVRLTAIGGSVTVHNQSGRVEVRDLSGAALTSNHSVETSYADIEFIWPASAGTPRYHLEASYGQITADFPGTTQERGSRIFREGEETAEGTAAIDLTTQSGSITLRRR